MRKWLALLFFLPGLLAAQTTAPDGGVPRRVFIIPIRQDVMSPLVYIVRRGVKEAMEAKADMILIDMDTYGGSTESLVQIIGILKQFKGKTVTYVDNKAFSAGALMSFATQKIYMAPQSVIGAAAVVQKGSGGSGIEALPDTVEIKLTSAYSALIRTEAEKNGYNVDIVDSMMNKNKELIVDGKTLNKKGEILTLTDNEASQKYGKPPKPLLSSGTVESLDALLDDLGYSTDSQRTTIAPTGAEKLGAWINAISPILLIIGIVGIYIEIKTPGVILPGVVAVLAFLLYFLGGYVAGLSGMEWVIVFVIGLALVISELFVHPGTIFPGLIGLGLILVALIMAMVDMYPGAPKVPSLPQIRLPIENLMIALMGSLVILAVLARILPKTSVYRNLVSQSASGVVTIAEKEQKLASRVGQVGTAISNLRPGGKAQFGSDIIDVITQGEMISKGHAVRIIGNSGTDAVVEADA